MQPNPVNPSQPNARLVETKQKENRPMIVRVTSIAFGRHFAAGQSEGRNRVHTPAGVVFFSRFGLLFFSPIFAVVVVVVVVVAVVAVVVVAVFAGQPPATAAATTTTTTTTTTTKTTTGGRPNWVAEPGRAFQ